MSDYTEQSMNERARELNAVCEAVESVSQRLEDLDEAIKDSAHTSNLEAFQNELRSSENYINSLKASFEAKLQTLESSQENQSQELDQIKVKNDESALRINELGSVLSSHAQSQEQTKEERAQAFARLQNIEVHLQELKNDVDHRLNGAFTHAEKFETQLLMLEVSLRELDERQGVLDKEDSIIVLKLRAELTSLLSTLRERVENLSGQTESLNHQTAELFQSRDEANRVREELKNALSNLEQNFAALNAAVSQQRRMIEAKQDAKQKDETVSAGYLKNQVESLSATTEALKDQCHNLAQTLDAQQDKFENRLSENANYWQSRLEEVVSQSSGHSREQAELLENLMLEMQEKIYEVSASLSEEIKKVGSNNRERVSALREEFEQFCAMDSQRVEAGKMDLDRVQQASLAELLALRQSVEEKISGLSQKSEEQEKIVRFQKEQASGLEALRSESRSDKEMVVSLRRDLVNMDNLFHQNVRQQKWAAVAMLGLGIFGALVLPATSTSFSASSPQVAEATTAVSSPAIAPVENMREEKTLADATNARLASIDTVSGADDSYKKESLKTSSSRMEAEPVIGSSYYSSSTSPENENLAMVETAVNKEVVKKEVHNTKSEAEPQYIRYTIKDGDSFWKISKEQLGAGKHYEKIMKDNKMTENDTLVPGKEIILRRTYL